MPVLALALATAMLFFVNLAEVLGLGPHSFEDAAVIVVVYGPFSAFYLAITRELRPQLPEP